ncbi:MAG: hypothetical protein KatS3mg015_0049 [Fimbriimonadales bacterium]|nr:MAG: hypothetical protein KatS3mg015_0049 [Fimbriimonadales bacterium]
MQFLSSAREDRRVPVLVGNGRIATFLGPSGYHEAGEEGSHHLQEIVLAGRRGPGPQFQLVSFGRVTRALLVDAEESEPLEREQTLDVHAANVLSRLTHDKVLESTRTLVLHHRNTLIWDTRITNTSDAEVGVVLHLRYRLEEQEGVRFRFLEPDNGSATISYQHGSNAGCVYLLATDALIHPEDDGYTITVSQNLRPGQALRVRLALTFSDRFEYSEPFRWEERAAAVARHEAEWHGFWDRSELITNDLTVDALRLMSLYTIACQATPWSIPPVLCREPWHGGAFHDELYPVLALLGSGHHEIAERPPYFRLACLPRAQLRAAGRGALYPWNSTEDGEERDPVGPWYTERHHLGAIAASAWFYFTYQKDIDVLADFYPMLKALAEYVAKEVLTKDERGRWVTRACTDFDESAPATECGPFTLAASAFVLSRAAEAAARLHLDVDRASHWEMLARELQANFPVDVSSRRYAMPEGVPDHVACLGYIAPFFVDDGSPYARNTCKILYEKLRTDSGFRPGDSAVFEGSAWMWTAGHLAMCFATLGEGDLAWDALRHGANSVAQFESPCEHIRADGSVAVPWFTTGCGAWLAGLHWMFARTDDNGDHLLDAVPESLSDFSFRGLRLSRGVSASARVEGGKLTFLSLSSPIRQAFSFEIPVRFAEGTCLSQMGRVFDLETHWRVQLDLLEGPNDLVSPA